MQISACMSGIIITLVYQATHPVTYSFRGYKKSVTAGQISFKFYKLANLAKQSIGVLQIQMTSNGMDLIKIIKPAIADLNIFKF